MTVHATRLPIRLLPDPRRVITRFFVPGEENRIRGIIERLCCIPRVEVETIVERLRRGFHGSSVRFLGLAALVGVSPAANEFSGHGVSKPMSEIKVPSSH